MVAITQDDRDPVEQLAEQFLDKVRAGEVVTVDEWAAEYPQHAAQIQELFPTLLMMEGGKPHDAMMSDGNHAASNSDPLLGMQVQQLGDFHIERCIGRGGMGVVYEATQESLSRRVALKVLSPSLFTTAETVGRFRREAKAAATLHHSNIVPVYSVGEQWGVHYYAMQFIDGAGLDAVLSKPNSEYGLRDDFIKIASLGQEVAEGLHCAHENGTLHRDIKPANLLLDQAGKLWISDFGLAKLIDVDDGLTCTGQTIGTTRYMPPEQFTQEVDHRGDIYSLGLTLYELVTWQPAYDESRRSYLVRQITTGELLPPSRINPKTPRDLETILLKCVSREPDHRYQTAAELAGDLERFSKGEPILARRLSLVERAGRWTKRNPAVAALSGLAVALLVAVAAVSTLGYLKTNAAYQQVADEHARASELATLANEALENIFSRFTPIDSQSADDTFSPQPVLSTESAEMLQELLVFYEQLAEQSDNESLLQKAANAQSKVARIHHQLGNHASAIRSHRDAIDRYTKLESDPSVDLSIASSHNHIGHILKLTGETDEANAEHLEAIAMLRRLGETPVAEGPGARSFAADLQFEIARSLYLKARHVRSGLGPNSLPPLSIDGRHPDRLRQVARIIAAREPGQLADLQQAIELLDELVTERPAETKYQHLLAVCLFEWANDAIDMRNDADWKAEERAFELLAKLTERHPQANEYQYSRLDGYTQIDLRSSELLSAKTLGTLKTRWESAMQIAEELTQNRPDVAIFASTLAQTAYQLGNVLEHLAVKAGQSNDSLVPEAERREMLVEAERMYRKAASRQGVLSKRYPDAHGYRVWWAMFQLTLSRVEHQQRQVDQAHVLATRAARVLDRLPAEVAMQPVVSRLSSRAYDQLGRILNDIGRRERGDRAKALADHFRELEGESPDRPRSGSRPGPPGRGPGRLNPQDLRGLFAPPPHRR